MTHPTVLVACDFSTHSRRALALAMQGYPFGTDVKVELLHVIDTDLYESVLDRDHVPERSEIVSYMRSEIERAEREILDAGGEVRVAPQTSVRQGRAYDELLEFVGEESPIGILLGGQGHGGAAERFLGGTAQRVVRHSECSVFVTCNSLGYSVPTHLQCAVDFSDPSRGALERSAALSEGPDRTFSLVCVVEDPYRPYLGAAVQLENMEAHRNVVLEHARTKLSEFETSVLGEKAASSSSVVTGRISDAIIAEAGKNGAQAIVVGSHGRTGVRRFLLGSVAEALLSSSPIDVLVAR
jgi:nucleotide-binding universal stress UspA family protein